MTPGATDDDIERMMKWISEEEDTIANGVVNYKLPKYVIKKAKTAKTLTFNQVKDFLHIFVDLDDDGSNSLEMAELFDHFRMALTQENIEEIFAF